MEPIKEDPYFSQTVETTSVDSLLGQWEFQDPKMEVLYHIRPYFVGIFPYIGLKNRSFFYGRYLQSIGSWPAWPLTGGCTTGYYQSFGRYTMKPE